MKADFAMRSLIPSRFPARATVVIIAATGIALLAAASASSHSTNTQQALAYIRCVRSHGVPRYPDPTSGNETASGLPKVSPQQLGVSSSQLNLAERACRRLLPTASQPTAAGSQQMLRKMENFALCMRSRGVSNWPDPKASTLQALSMGAPAYMFHLDGLQGLDGRSFSPRIADAITRCQHRTGSQVPYSG